MKNHISTEAIILKHWDYGEKDQIISFITRERGRLQGIAKGAKSSRYRFAGSLDLFCWSHLSFQEKKTGTLVFIQQARAISSFPQIRSDYNSILLATGLLEMVYRFYREGEVDSRGFDILHGGLNKLDKLGSKKEIFWSCFLIHLKAVGLAPQFHQCVKCRNEVHPSEKRFDPAAGGIICKSCSFSSIQCFPISETLIDWINVFEGKEKFLLKEDEILLNQLLSEHLKYQMGLDLGWSRFLDFV
jgi:DNA repair protein RecO (recombination protein O)